MIHTVETEKILRVTHWPFDDMQVGDYFDVPKGIARTTVFQAVWRAQKPGKGRYKSRTKNGVTRVWRYE